MSTKSESTHTTTTAPTLTRRSPWRSRKAFCAPIARIRDSPVSSPSRDALVMYPTLRPPPSEDKRMFLYIHEPCLTGLVDINPGQLDALVAIADRGSFEAAAQQLHITPSAVSQRIRALEAAAGQVLVSRGTPCRPTPHGERLVRLGRQTRLLYDETSQALTSVTAVELPVAVNADSLATWFRDVLAEAATWMPCRAAPLSRWGRCAIFPRPLPRSRTAGGAVSRRTGPRCRPLSSTTR